MSTKAKLTCSLTGNTRQSSHKYIAKKAEQYGVSSEVFQEYYVSKQAYLQFKSDLDTLGVDNTLEKYNMDKEYAEAVLKLNGKSRKTLNDFKNTNTPNPTSKVESTEESTVESVPALA